MAEVIEIQRSPQNCRSFSVQDPTRFCQHAKACLSCLVCGLETYFDAQLRREGYAHGCSRTEKIAQCACGITQLVQVSDRLSLRAGRVQAERRRVGQIVYRRGQRRDVGNKKCAGVIAVEQIEKLRERHYGPALL